MKIEEFQRLSKRTLNKELTKEQTLSNMVMGISGEAGEVADIIKKHLYQGHRLNKQHLAEELGDVMFYIVNLANTLNLDMRDILEANIKKLEARYPQGFEAERSINRG